MLELQTPPTRFILFNQAQQAERAAGGQTGPGGPSEVPHRHPHSQQPHLSCITRASRPCKLVLATLPRCLRACAVMDSSATVLRRSSRAAAAAAMTRLRASAAGGDAGRPAEAPAVPPTVKPAQAMQQRKRRRTAKNSEAAPAMAEPVPPPAAATASPPAAEEEGVPQAQARRRGGAKKAAAAAKKAAAVAVGGPSREYEEAMWAQGYANVAGGVGWGGAGTGWTRQVLSGVIPPRVCWDLCMKGGSVEAITAQSTAAGGNRPRAGIHWDSLGFAGRSVHHFHAWSQWRVGRRGGTHSGTSRVRMVGTQSHLCWPGA